jgi:hypothetical protein
MSTQSVPGDGRLEPSLSAIMSEQRQLINLAYRLLLMALISCFLARLLLVPSASGSPPLALQHLAPESRLGPQAALQQLFAVPGG